MLTREEAIAYLTQDGNLLVPCSRYGRDSESCAPVAYQAYLAYLDAAGCEGDTFELLDELMGLVVNDHDDIAHLLGMDESEES